MKQGYLPRVHPARNESPHSLRAYHRFSGTKENNMSDIEVTEYIDRATKKVVEGVANRVKEAIRETEGESKAWQALDDEAHKDKIKQGLEDQVAKAKADLKAANVALNIVRNKEAARHIIDMFTQYVTIDDDRDPHTNGVHKARMGACQFMSPEYSVNEVMALFDNYRN